MHVQMAHHLGQIAALNITSRKPHLVGPVVPFIWTQSFGRTLRYAGYSAPGFDSMRMYGEPGEQRFIAYYLRRAKVIGVASMGYDPVVARYAEVVRQLASSNGVAEKRLDDDPFFESLAQETFSKVGAQQ